MTIGQPNAFGSLVREHRLAVGLTQEELAERAGISARAISDLERGLYQVPHRDTVARLAAALGLDQDGAARLEALVVRQRGPSAATQERPRDEAAFSAPVPPLPTGIVSFLSAEAESSPSLDALQIEALRTALGGQRRAIDEAVSARGGARVRAPEGDDQWLAVFATASAAVAAALDIRRRLADERLPGEPPLRLRLAVHAGEAELRDGAYYGSAPSRCRRLRSLAAGGRTLVSQAAIELARGSLPGGALLRDLGEHHLTDVGRPEHIFELTAEGLPAAAGPPSAASLLAAHYETVVRGLLEGRVVLFAGDAMNLAGRGNGVGWQPDRIAFPPTAREVADSLAGRFAYPSGAPRELSRVAQYVSTMAGSGPLFEELHTIFRPAYRPTPLHAFLALLSRAVTRTGGARSYPLIVSSSYDDALERAFTEADQAFDLVSYVVEGDLRGRFVHRPPDGRLRVIDKPNKYIGLSFEERPIILKVHGTSAPDNAEQESFVVTEDHFLDYLTGGDLSSAVPVTVAARLRRGHFLFLGYGVGEWNLRVILHRLWGEQRLSYKSWAVHAEPPDAMERGRHRERGAGQAGGCVPGGTGGHVQV